jgi:phosphatidylglycerophosphate synthase
VVLDANARQRLPIATDVGHERRGALAGRQRYSPRPLTEGERWTVDALFELRRGGFRPRAWVRFLASSLERSGDTRRARPLLARQGRRWGAAGAVAWIVAWQFSRQSESVRLRLFPTLSWWAIVWKMLDWHLGMAEGGDGVPHERLSLADAVTLARFWLVPAPPALARSSSGLPIVIVFAGASDWLDGALARRRGRTRLGRDLDTTADLAFLAAAAVSAHRADRLTGPGFHALVGRQALGVTLAVGAVFGRARRPAIRARPWGSVLRFGGLALCTAGLRRTGSVALVTGCLVLPRSTMPKLSPA